jgi:RHS repeat-associated protein
VVRRASKLAKPSSTPISIPLASQGTTSLDVPDAGGTAGITYQRYKPYGQQRGGDTITTTDHGFLGQVEDTTGLTYLNARYLDPALGRFISVDPLVDVTRDAYGYGNNNPITYSDPTGLCAITYGLMSGDDGKECTANTALVNQGASVLNNLLNGSQSDGLILASNWGELGSTPGAGYWDAAGTNICFGGLACTQANIRYIEDGGKTTNAVFVASSFCINNFERCADGRVYLDALGDFQQTALVALGLGVMSKAGASRAGVPQAEIDAVDGRISRQAQARHIGGTPEWTARGQGGYFAEAADAQAVLDAVKSGTAQVLGRTANGQLLVRFDGVTGFNNNPAAGFVDQPTNVFIVKGTSKVSVVPTSPGATAR